MSDKNITKRLSRDTSYTKTKKSYQEKLSPDEIKKKLEEYKQVEFIDDVNLNSHLRYFTFNEKTGKKQFRLGGFLTKIDKEYVILSNGSLSWSVQKKNTIFFQKMNFTDLKDELIEKISRKFEKKIQKLNDENRLLKDTLKKVKKQLKKK